MPHAQASDGTDLYIKDWGHGRPVVLIHGWPLSADMWDDVGLALAENGFRVIAYDRRGFGRSGQPFSGYDYDTLADDLGAVIAATGAEETALVGFSMGGGEVARYMSRHGGRGVRKAALISSVVPYMHKDESNPEGVDASALDQIKEGLRKDRAHYLAGFFPSFYGVGIISSPVSDEILDWTLAVAMQAGLKGTLDCVDSFGKTDFRPDLPSFRVPTLIVHGTSDKTVPIDASARAAAKGIAGSRLVEYDGAPHGLVVTEKDRLIEDLIGFLA